MNRRTLFVVLGTCILAGGLFWSLTADERVEVVPLAAGSAQSDRDHMERQIEFYSRRAKADPWSAGDRSSLAMLYLQRSRETGRHEDVVLAEQMARESLRLRPEHNVNTWAVLAASLLEQHRFADAREAAARLVDEMPENPAYRAYLAEIEMELGDYDAAGKLFTSLQASREHLDVAPRLARFLEISGKPGEARALLTTALDRARGSVTLPREQLAWFHLRIGDLELRHGRFDEAERAFRAGLEVFPDDYRLLSAMARLRAARGEWDDALEYGERVIAQLLDPGTLGLMSEVYEAKGDRASAEEYAGVMRTAIQEQTTGFHREWALFLLDRGAEPAAILEQADRDLAQRRDIYGHDLRAWALHRQGRHREAAAAMERAMRLGTEDARLFYHSGMIHRALGEAAEAERDLERALEINPAFHPTEASAARTALGKLRGRRPWYRRLGI